MGRNWVNKVASIIRTLRKKTRSYLTWEFKNKAVLLDYNQKMVRIYRIILVLMLYQASDYI